HPAHFTRPEAPRVDNMLRVHIPLVGDHIPGTVGPRLEINNTCVAYHLGAGDLRGFGICLRHAIRVDVALDGIEYRPDEMALVEQRKATRGLLDRQHLELHAEITAARLRHP